MTTFNRYQVFILKDSTPIMNEFAAYLSRKGHSLDNISLSGSELFNLFPQKFKQLEQAPKEDSHIKVFNGKKNIDIPKSDILYIQASHVYIEINLVGGQKVVERCSLKNLLEQLPNNEFVQTHRSFAVNISKVENWNRTSVSVEGKNIPISRKHSKLVHKLLEK